MKTIPLTHGYEAIVDDEDYIRVSYLKWRVQINRHKGCVHHYAMTTYQGRSISMHRLILPGIKRVDHIDGNGLNNSRSNLRACTPSQNGANRHRQRSGFSSTFMGVYKCSDKPRHKNWMASITHSRKTHKIARCETEEEAAIYYNVAAQLFHGEYANLNKV